MPPFAKPRSRYVCDVAAELARLREHKHLRGVPAKSRDTLLLATWNIANLGQQRRTDADLTLIAEVMRWFDVVAVQECKEDCAHLAELTRRCGRSYRFVCSDVCGNDERLAFVYDTRRVRPLEEIGEIAFPPTLNARLQLKGVAARFAGFDRTPYLMSLRAAQGERSLILANVHLYYGGTSAEDLARRSLETLAVAKWADGRRRSQYSANRSVVALGDFNMPKEEQGNPVFDALTRYGLVLPEHSSVVGSAIASDAHYDQIAFFPGSLEELLTGRSGVFDFDAVVFSGLHGDGSARRVTRFREYCRYHLSDHRPMWVEVRA